MCIVCAVHIYTEHFLLLLDVHCMFLCSFSSLNVEYALLLGLFTYVQIIKLRTNKICNKWTQDLTKHKGVVRQCRACIPV